MTKSERMARIMKWKRSHRAAVKRQSLRNRYGGKGADVYYARQNEKQKSRCAICGRKTQKALSQDHSHACCAARPTCGKCSRGLLCWYCNTGLSFIENLKWRRKAERYLRQWRRK